MLVGCQGGVGNLEEQLCVLLVILPLMRRHGGGGGVGGGGGGGGSGTAAHSWLCLPSVVSVHLP